MIKRSRLVIATILAAILASAGVIFGPVLLESVLKPVAMGIWFLAHILILSVDQVRLWAFLIVALCMFIVYRVARAMLAASTGQADKVEPDTNTALGDLEYWRYMFAQTPRDEREYGFDLRELLRLLLAAYASKERANDFGLYADFKSRKVPLPEGVYSFLFEGDRVARTKLSAWLRQVSGRDRVEYRRAIEQYLEFLKSYMEIRDDE